MDISGLWVLVGYATVTYATVGSPWLDEIGPASHCPKAANVTFVRIERTNVTLAPIGQLVGALLVDSPNSWPFASCNSAHQPNSSEMNCRSLSTLPPAATALAKVPS